MSGDGEQPSLTYEEMERKIAEDEGAEIAAKYGFTSEDKKDDDRIEAFF